MIPPVADIHTHNPEATDAVINLEPGMAMRPDALYSVGWHPWQPGADMEWVERMAAHRQVVMIGECGIDKLRGVGTVDSQIELTRRHALLAEQTGKPLILHIVGAWNEITALRKQMKPTQPWIIHGFRGKPALASQLVGAGFHISIGQRHNPAITEAVPPDRLLHETD